MVQDVAMVAGICLLSFCPPVSMKGFMTYCKIQTLRLQNEDSFPRNKRTNINYVTIRYENNTCPHSR